MHQTSKEAYKEVQPKLPALWELVLECLEQSGPRTAIEISKAVGRKNVWQRLSELERKGKVHQSGVRICEVTGAEATIWDIGGAAKQDRPKPPTPAAAKALLEDLTDLYTSAKVGGYENPPRRLVDLVLWLRARSED